MYREESMYFEQSAVLTPVVAIETVAKETKPAPLQVLSIKLEKG